MHGEPVTLTGRGAMSVIVTDRGERERAGHVEHLHHGEV